MQQLGDFDTIALRIKQRRAELNLSLQDVADMTGLSKSTLQRYESGYIRNIPLQKLGVLADALQTNPDFILGLTNSPDTRIATQVDIDHFGEKEPPEGWGYTDDEIDIIEKFKRLPLDDRNLIQKMIDYCFNRFIKRENKHDI